jgi:hypothetical protein
MISRTCAAVRSGRSRLSANASSSIAAGVRDDPRLRNERLEPTPAIRADPPIQRAARDPDHAAVRTNVIALGQRPHQPAALRLRQRRVGRVPDERVPEQTDLSATVSISCRALAHPSAGPSQLTSPT